MVQLTVLSVIGAIDAPRPAGGKSPDSGLFALALAQVGDGDATPSAAADIAVTPSGERQDAAAPGKELPPELLAELLLTVDGEDKAEPVATRTAPNEAALRKLRRPGIDDLPSVAAVVVPPIVAVPIEPGVRAAPHAIAAPPETASRAIVATLAPLAAAPGTAGRIAAATDRPVTLAQFAVASESVSAQALASALAAPVEKTAASIAPAPTLQPAVESASRIELPHIAAARAAVPIAAPSLVASPVAQPAGQAFAEAMFVAERPASRRPDTSPPLSASVSMLTGAPTETAPIAVAASSAAQDAPLDTSRNDWMGKMIEQIETLRDDGGVRETRMRLAPEGLGRVDVSIRHDGDTVRVHLSAETPAARQLIADAAPRLAEMAEARGLKLDQAGVGGGGAQPDSGRARADHPISGQASAPTSALTDPAADDVSDSTDTRIA